MTTLTETNTLQEKGNQAASKFLGHKGYKILEQDWGSKFGTADIIAIEDDTLVFVEVKTRTNTDCGFPEETAEKEARLKFEKLAIEYLAQADVRDMAVRFDTVSLLVVNENRAFLRHHINCLEGVE